AFYDCGRRHPQILTTQPADFYPETSWEEGMELAAVQLYRLTRRASYIQDALRFDTLAGPGPGALSLYSIHGLAHAELILLAPRGDRHRLREHLRAGCDQALARARPPFWLAVEPTWGTAGRACGAGALCLLAAPILGDPSLKD